MEAYRYFGLTAAPFEGRPEPRFFFRAACHAETLATLQYVVHAGKSCSLVLGESGSGKTLLGRLVAENANRQARILWVHGFGQPDGQTELTVYPPGSLNSSTLASQGGPMDSSLAEWIRTPARLRQRTIVIVDNADALRKHSWEDLLALMTREGRTPKPTSLILLGLPDTLERLSNPRFVRLRRRVFRTCHLVRFTEREVGAYIAHRLTLCGGRADLFTPEAIESVSHYSTGNPALINQICDNALVDAFSDERQVVDAEHILASVQAIAGPDRRHVVPPVRAALPEGPPVTPADEADEADVADQCVLTPPPETEDVLDENGDDPGYWTSPSITHAATATGLSIESDSGDRLVRIASECRALQQEGKQPQRSGAPSMPTFTAPGQPTLPIWQSAVAEADPAQEQLRERLQAIEGRVTAALSRVREARRLRRPSPPTLTEPYTPEDGASEEPEA